MWPKYIEFRSFSSSVSVGSITRVKLQCRSEVLVIVAEILIAVFVYRFNELCFGYIDLHKRLRATCLVRWLLHDQIRQRVE